LLSPRHNLPDSASRFLHTFIKNCRRHDAICPTPQVDFCTNRFYNNGYRAFCIFSAFSAHIYWKLLSSRRDLPGSISRFLHK
jgi:hypothetical protein